MANFRSPCNCCSLGQLCFWISTWFGPNRGVYQLAKNEPIWKFYNNFLYKMQIDRRSISSRKLPNPVLGAPQCCRFEQMGVSANLPKLAQFQKISTISCTKSKLKGGLFYGKSANLFIWGPPMRAVSNKCGCLPIGPKWTNFEYSTIYCTKSKFKEGFSPCEQRE